MKKKVWDMTIVDNPNRAVAGEQDVFYTTDTEAFLVFRLTDKEFRPTNALLSLNNRNDGSVVSEDVSVSDEGVIMWEMREDIIAHPGNWQAQLVYEQEKSGKIEKYTSSIVSFSVEGHLLDSKEPSLVEIQNWEKFIANGTELIEEWGDMEALRQANEVQRQDNYQELLDTGVLQANINNKLEQLEEEYAPKLTEVTAQLAQTEYHLQEQIQGLDSNINEELNDRVKHRPIHTGGSVPSNTLGEDGDLFLQTYGEEESRFYEEGTFTPTLRNGSSEAEGLVYSNQDGSFVRVGNVVTVTIRLGVSSVGVFDSPSIIQIGGLPYNFSKIGAYFLGDISNLILPNSSWGLSLSGTPGNKFVQMRYNRIESTATGVPYNMLKDGFRIITSFTYEINVGDFE